MSLFVIWIDREHAKLFQLSHDKMERKTLNLIHQNHHTHRMDQLDIAREVKHLFGDIAAQMKDASKVLILGPGVAKHHFQTYLVEHFPAIAKKVVACETVDHPSDAQIASYARRYFSVAAS